MSFPALQTPQRPLPGAFFNTPAPSRFGQSVVPQPPLFRQQSFSQQQQQQQQQQQASTSTSSQLIQQQAPQPRQQPQSHALNPVQRAARTINEVLQREANFPDLDSYVRQGISADYELPNQTTEPAWAPFHRTKMYDIPDKIFEQYNRAEFTTAMGLFAELNHAWVTIDNALYMWDYTNPNPEIIGYEDQPNSITAVKLVLPRAGVFVNTITHLLVVATTAEIILLGVASSTEGSGVKTVALYQTKMSTSVKGNVLNIAGSSATGRIFFSGPADNDVYEMTYQQEEKWFTNRCGRINHTSPGYTSLVPTIWSSKTPEHVVDMVVDDSRRLLYTLSSESSIRTFHMDSPTTLQQVIEKKRQECLRDISHMISQSNLLGPSMKICSISPISAKEGSKLHLMATTSTGCRLFLSATRGYGYLVGQGAPQSMQVQHIKFPPRLDQRPPGSSYSSNDQPAEASSMALAFTRQGLRLPPGLFFCFVRKSDGDGQDQLFVSGPDTGRISAQARDLTAQATKYYEQACWVALNSRAEDIGLVTKPFGASQQPLGFGNELAVQFDQPPTEVAILTNTGIHIIRRRRLVDIFAAAIRNGGGDDGLDNEIKKFIRLYGRGETTATALAVACGQGSDANVGDRIARINGPETLELARRAFVEYGGRPSLNENTLSEGGSQAIDNVRPSSRHEGLALYMARLVRSLWKSSVISQGVAPSGAITISSAISSTKLVSVQDDLTKLFKFLESNRSFIDGLAGPESLRRVSSQSEEVALQGEHQALHSLQLLTSSIIEGISFVQMLFDERVDEIWISLDDTVRQRLRDLTFELLFSTDQGKDLAKALVKAIVNRNIANGSNVDTVADALRRRCGSFCSADDVIIFKAQEQLKKTSEVGANSDQGRNLLNESLRLFQQVAGALSFDNLQNAAQQFSELQFFAGAIKLALLVAKEFDRGNRALAWVNANKPSDDARAAQFNFRKQCYDLIHQILLRVDEVTGGQPEEIDGRPTLAATKRREAYAVVNDSDDELFHYDLYEWYLSQKWVDRLLAVDSEFVVAFLTRNLAESVERADLLWRYYTHHGDYFKAAKVQLDLAKSEFEIPLAQRIQYLSRAKANASAQVSGSGRQARQMLLHEVSELLEVANIQDELLHRLKGDERIAADRKPVVTQELDGQIISITDLYNKFADQASYFDICLILFEAADYRNEAEISATWQQLLDDTHAKVADDPAATQSPYEAVVSVVKDIAHRLNLSENTFPPQILIPMLEAYAHQSPTTGPRNWTMDLFIDVGFPFETLLGVLQGMWYNSVAPFTGRHKLMLAEHMLYVCEQWYEDCVRSNVRLYGGDANAAEIAGLLELITQQGLRPEEQERALALRRRIERAVR